MAAAIFSSSASAGFAKLPSGLLAYQSCSKAFILDKCWISAASAASCACCASAVYAIVGLSNSLYSRSAAFLAAANAAFLRSLAIGRIAAASRRFSTVNFMGRFFSGERWQSENSNGSRLDRPAIFLVQAGQGA